MFYGYQSSIIHALWISIWISLDFYGYPCIDLLGIIDPGLASFQDQGLAIAITEGSHILYTE